MANEKIRLDMTLPEAIMAMSDGNPGALSVMIGIIKEEHKMVGLSPFVAILLLDTYGIYGSSIWILYKDICGSDLSKFVGVLRATQMGFLSAVQLRNLTTDMAIHEDKIDVDSLCAKVLDHQEAAHELRPEH